VHALRLGANLGALSFSVERERTVALFGSECYRKDAGTGDVLCGTRRRRVKIQSQARYHLPLSAIKTMEFSGMPTLRATSLNSCRRLSLSCGSRPANRKQKRY